VYLEKILEEIMKWERINEYSYDSFFRHYFVPDENAESWLFNYEKPILDYVLSVIPKYIENVIIFGCASGRDFIPFQDRFNCYGFDLESGDKIKWVCSTERLTYYQCNIQDFLANVERFNHIDFSKSLVYTQGTLMYLTSTEQDQFVNTILGLGCKNMALHEYPPDWMGYSIHTKFNPSLEVLQLFEHKHFREQVDDQPTGFLIIDREV
jgi:hypothetical protein